MKRTLSFLIWLILLFTAPGCGPKTVSTPTLILKPIPTIPTSTPFKASPTPERMQSSYANNMLTVYVDASKPLQTLKNVSGGNFINKYSGSSLPIDPISQYNLDNLTIKVARVRLGLEDWEPINDNEDADVINQDAFKDTGFVHATFLLMQELEKRGVEIIASIWDIPGWMAYDPNAESNKLVVQDMYPEVLESMTAWLLTARDQYGVNVSYVSFNEPNIGVNVSLIPRENAEMVRQGGRRFRQAGLETKWLLADFNNIANSVSYAESMWAEEDIRPYLGPFSIHSWDATAGDGAFLKVREFAQANDLEVWITEGGWDAQLWNRPQEFPGWPNALRLGAIYCRLLKMSGATTILYWEMAGRDYNINDGAKGFPIFEVIHAYDEQLPPGAQVVETSTDTDSIYFMAAKTSDHFVVFLVNINPIKEQIRIEGLPAGKYTYYVYDREQSKADSGIYDSSAGAVVVEIGGFSFNILTTK